MTTKPKSVTGVIHLPKARLNFYLSFDDKESAETVGQEAEMIGRILEKAVDLSPRLREILGEFAEQLKQATTDTSGQSP